MNFRFLSGPNATATNHGNNIEQFKAYFDQHTNFTAHMDIGLNGTFGCCPARPLLGRGQTFFAQKIDRLTDIAVAFTQRFLPRVRTPE